MTVEPIANPALADLASSARTVALMAAYNEDRFIGSVVDDGSADSTAGVAQAAGARGVPHDRNPGKSAALNTGLELQSPRAVVCVDKEKS